MKSYVAPKELKMEIKHNYTPSEIDSAFNARLAEHPRIARYIEGGDQVEAIAVAYLDKNCALVRGKAAEERLDSANKIDAAEVLYQKTRHIKGS